MESFISQWLNDSKNYSLIERFVMMKTLPRRRLYLVSGENCVHPSFRETMTILWRNLWHFKPFQNLNSDFTDSALGSKEKSPLPYGNFQLRESTMQSILNNPKYGPKSELGETEYTQHFETLTDRDRYFIFYGLLCFRDKHVHLPQIRASKGNASGSGGGIS